MYLVAIGWIYVVFMMSITEETVVAGVMTFIFYGMVPVAIIMYLGGSRRRRIKRQMEEELRRNAARSSQETPAAAQEEEKDKFPST